MCPEQCSKDFSSHSFRRGVATEAARWGRVGAINIPSLLGRSLERGLVTHLWSDSEARFCLDGVFFKERCGGKNVSVVECLLFSSWSMFNLD